MGKLKVPCWFHWPTGSRCEDCAAGFFGNPSEVGGTCQPCQCHHNIDTTDPEACDKETGRCLKCLYHTEGVHCQLCRLGYYGDALQQDCRSKTCSPFAGSSFVGMTSILFLLFLLLFLFLLLLTLEGPRVKTPLTPGSPMIAQQSLASSFEVTSCSSCWSQRYYHSKDKIKTLGTLERCLDLLGRTRTMGRKPSWPV